MKIKITSIILFFIFIINISLTAQSNPPTVKTTKITKNLYQFYIFVNSNSSVNIFALVGDDGVLLIDSAFDFSADLVKDELKKIGHTNIKYIINTHNDGDHTLGNPILGKNATIISHNNCRKVLSNNLRYPKSALPDITFEDTMTLNFNGEEIIITYLPGHTNNDCVVYFKKSNFAFLGDLVFSHSFPVIHDSGNLYSLLKNLKKMDTIFTPNTRLFVSHGDEINLEEKNNYRNMIIETSNIISKKIIEGYSPVKTKKKNVLKNFKSWNSKVFPAIDTNRWVDTLYSHSKEGQEHSAAKKLNTILISKGIKAAKLELSAIRESGKYFFIETEFNGIGYALLNKNKVKESIFMFKINTDLFPESWNAYDSLGEAYAKNNNIKLSIENYEKSIKLNPENRAGKKILKELRLRQK